MLIDTRTHVQSSWNHKFLPDGNLSLENEDMSRKMRTCGNPKQRGMEKSTEKGKEFFTRQWNE
jgi:hypothetical protein